MINKLPQISLVFDRRKIASSSRRAAIEVRVTYDKKQKYISTGISLYKNQWKKDTIVEVKDAVVLNQFLERMVTDIRQVIYAMVEEGNIDIHQIPERLEKLKDGRPSFLEFCSSRAEVRKYGRAKDSQERYDRFIRLFRKWGGIKDFSDISDNNIIAYDKFLSAQGMKPYSKWNNYHRFLNSFIIDAIDAGYLRRNPYKWVNINKEKTSAALEKYLSVEEFRKLKDAPMPTKCLERVRDLFVFQTYTCLRYSDLAEFNSNNIDEVAGMKVYRCMQKKTSKPAVIPLLPAALSILYKYNKVLPVISNVKYNTYLKVVAQAAGIEKNISSHWARHTGATMLLNEGIDMRIVSKICGHSSTRITEQIYAKLLDETVVDAIKGIDKKGI